MILATTAYMRLRTFPATITAGGKTKSPLDGMAESVDVAGTDAEVQRILHLRDTATLDWVALYRILEAIKASVDVVAQGWVPKNELKRFKHTANSVAAVGDEARHGTEPQRPPKQPMKIEEARTLIDSILTHWLTQRTSVEPLS